MRTFLSRFLSVLFIPLLIPIFSALLVVWSNPYAFGGWRSAMFFILQILIWTLIIPGVALLIMKQLDMIGDLNLSDRKDRIIPYFVILISYSIAFYAIFRLPIPGIVKAMVAGSLLSIIVSFFMNNFLKVSAHANGMGSLAGAILGLALSSLSIYNIDWLVVLAFLASGAVMSARLHLKAHSLQEVFLGFIVGFCSQILAIMAFQVYA